MSCLDPTAVIVVRNAKHVVRAIGSTQLLVQQMLPGVYRIQLMTAEGATLQQLVEVTAGEPTVAWLDAPGPRLGRDQQRMLEALDIRSVNGCLHPSEHLDGFANASLASLLAFAAFRRALAGSRRLQRMRKFGVPAMNAIAPGRTGVMVIVGVSGARPAPGVDREQFLEQAQVVLRDLEGVTLDVDGVTLLSGMPAAGQRSIGIQPGSLLAELRLPGMAPTRFALAALPDRLTLLVAAAEDSGVVDVQQYPWFDLDDEHRGDVAPSERLRRTQSLGERDAQREAAPDAVDRDVEPGSVVDLTDRLD